MRYAAVACSSQCLLSFDTLARLGVDEEGLSKAGHYTLVFGLVGGVGAAATGVLDYYDTRLSRFPLIPFRRQPGGPSRT